MKIPSHICVGTFAVFALSSFLYSGSTDLEERVKRLEQSVDSLKKENTKLSRSLAVVEQDARAISKNVDMVRRTADRNRTSVADVSREVRNVSQNQKRSERDAASALRLARSNQSAISRLRR